MSDDILKALKVIDFEDDPPEYSHKDSSTLIPDTGKSGSSWKHSAYEKCTRCEASMSATDFHFGCSECVTAVCICAKCNDATPTCRIHKKELIERTIKAWRAVPSFVDHISPAPAKDDNPLIHALKSNNEELITFHAHDAELINAHTYLGYTPLHFAAHLGLISAATILLSNGALTNSRDIFNMTPLLVAINLKQFEIVELLLRNNANLHSVCGMRETTALHVAAANGLSDLVSSFLDKGAIIDASSGRGTALQLASIIDSFECASILLERGANPNSAAGTLMREPPLCSATRNHNEKLVDLLMKFGAKIDLAGFMKPKNPMPDGKDINYTALYLAIVIEDCTIAGKLIQCGADVNWEDNSGLTHLMRAVALRKKTMCELLIDNGADMNAETSTGINVVLLAACSGKEDILEMLLEKGASAKPPKVCRGKWKGLERLFRIWKVSLCKDLTEEAKPRILKRLRDAKHDQKQR